LIAPLQIALAIGAYLLRLLTRSRGRENPGSLVVVVLVPVTVVLGVVMTVVDVVDVVAVLDGLVATVVTVDVLVLFFVDLVDLNLGHGASFASRRHTPI
jgi:hypothetical protein